MNSEAPVPPDALVKGGFMPLSSFRRPGPLSYSSEPNAGSSSPSLAFMAGAGEPTRLPPPLPLEYRYYQYFPQQGAIPFEVINPLSESCFVRTVGGTVAGGVMGVLFGMFLGAIGSDPTMQLHASGKEVPQAPMSEQFRLSWRATTVRSVAMGWNLASISGLFTGFECVVEKARGKHDVMNAMLSGCAAGAAIQAKSGPASSAMGCAGFAAFSVVAEQLMGPH